MKKSFVVLFALMMAATASAVDEAIYYIAGNMNEWATSNPAYQMTRNTEAIGDEFVITLDLAAGAQFKVVKVEGSTTTWIPDGMGNAYGEVSGTEITAAGKYDIYFRPAKDGGDGWYEKMIFVQKNTGAGIDAVVGSSAKSVKIMENGNVYILRNGVKYNANGAAVK